MVRSFGLIIALLLGPASSQAADQQITVFGLSENKAMVSFSGGKIKVLKPGDKLGDGIALHSADRNSAVFLIDGKKQSFSIGQQISANTPAPQSGKLTLTADSSGHFFANGSINGGSIRFLVDTGATMVFLSATDARRLGINYLKGEPGYSGTAGGTIRVYRINLDTVRIGDLSASNVQAVVSEKDSTPFALLGMTFLNRMKMDRDGDQLTLTQRY